MIKKRCLHVVIGLFLVSPHAMAAQNWREAISAWVSKCETSVAIQVQTPPHLRKAFRANPSPLIHELVLNYKSLSAMHPDFKNPHFLYYLHAVSSADSVQYQPGDLLLIHEEDRPFARPFVVLSIDKVEAHNDGMLSQSLWIRHIDAELYALTQLASPLIKAKAVEIAKILDSKKVPPREENSQAQP